jgi:prepilin-type N-terminal cleavage/methylation domain-containing protein
MIKFFIQKNKGFTLVETLVAISIFSMSIVAIMSVLGSGISDTSYAKQKIIAGYLAQEGIEYIRNMRDTDVLYDDTESAQTGWDNFKVSVSSCTSPDICGFDNSAVVKDVFLCSANENQCKLYIDNGDYNSGSVGVDSNFTRTVQVVADSENLDEVKVYSKVTWTHKSGDSSIILTENLFNWVE